jgi:hypothetical protein
VAASRLILGGKRERPRPSPPCPDACNPAPFFKSPRAVTALRGTVAGFFSRILRIFDPHSPSCQRSYHQGRLRVQLCSTGREQYAGRKCDSIPKTWSRYLEPPMVGISPNVNTVHRRIVLGTLDFYTQGDNDNKMNAKDRLCRLIVDQPSGAVNA